MPDCQHTLYHANTRGDLLGSWTLENIECAESGNRHRVVCQYCRRFYGYLPELPMDAKLPPASGFTACFTKSKTVGGSSTNTVQGLPNRPIDFKQLKALVSIGQVLELLDYRATSKRGAQLRGPCPIHEATRDRGRIFSVHLERGIFQCFKCKAKGNQLDLFASVTKLGLKQAARNLCEQLGLEIPYLD